MHLQHDSLPFLQIAFYDNLTRACAEIKILDEKVTNFFRLCGFWNCFIAFPFHFLFAVVIDLLGLFAVKKLERKRPRDWQLPGVVAGNFALSFSINFLIWPITLIWASLEIIFSS